MRLNSTGGGFCRPRHTPLLHVLFLVAGLLQSGHGTWQLKELARWERGADFGCIVPFGSASDSVRLLAFAGDVPGGRFGLHFYRYVPVNRYTLVKVDTTSGSQAAGNSFPWAAGEFDGDSDQELIGITISSGFALVTAYTTPHGSGIPDSLEYGTRYGGAGVASQSLYLTDLDRDGRKELTLNDGSYLIRAFELQPGDSLEQTISVPCDNGYDLAIGDFDGDGLIEVATTGLSWNNWITVYKCTGNNLLVPWDSTPIARINGGMFSASNLDGTHRAVIFASYFIVGGYAYLYEVEPTNGTHDYQPVLIDSTMDGGEVYAQSVCGDIDGDGLDEVLWSVGNQIRGYKPTGAHQYELVWSWLNSGNNTCYLGLYDMNGNGYNEILESGAGQTHIFEIEAIRVLNPNTNITLHPGDTCRIRWETFTPPRCDSVSLFLRTDTTWHLDTLIHGLPPTDTAWTWTVPDIRSDYCHVVAIAYGPGWQYDESDTFFHILPLGVEEAPSPPVSETRLIGASPNPCAGTMRISFQIGNQGQSTTVQSLISLRVCDVSGRTVATLADGAVKPGVYHRDWEVAPTDPNGVYFIRLETPDCRETQKVILTR